MTVPLIRRVLVTTDFSELSAAAMEYARAVYRLLDIDIYLIHVIDRSNYKKSGKTLRPNDEKNATKQLSALAKKYLAECGSVQKIIRRGEPYREIVQYARQEKIDLIIISTHGRTGLSHVLLGSVAERVVRLSPSPVLTVKPSPIQTKLMEQEDVDEQLHLK